MRLRRAKGEAPSVLMAGSLAVGSSLLGELLGFAVSYWPTRSGAAFRRCSARASAQSAPLGASLVIGQPLPAAGAGVGTAQLSSSSRPVHRLDPHLDPRRGWIHLWRSGRFARRLVGARRLAAPACAEMPVARPRALELSTRRRRDGRAIPRLEAPDARPPTTLPFP